MSTTANRDAPDVRLEARVPPELKAIAQRTAARRGLSLSSFLCQALWNEIERASDQHRVIALSVADSAAVDAVLADHEAPNEAMRAAVASYRERYGH
jgi:uncharacterized protein (DUF1778 family)